MKKNNWDHNEFKNFKRPERTDAVGNKGDFNLTFVADAGLTIRLTNEVQFLLKELQQAWPVFKRDPAG
ncbi:MAG: hypothetical protein AABM67_05540, partial [Acidobacteriota bacterium]